MMNDSKETIYSSDAETNNMFVPKSGNSNKKT
jgi:hypothetical protein